ncbi:MAG: MBL fold metallo-hydrolase [Patescibacteria group bacterium]
MKITLLGTGAPYPDPQRNAPGFLLEHDEVPYLIDCGGGVCHQLAKIGCPGAKLDNIFISHIHIDHCVEFPALVFSSYLTGKEGSFHLFGPAGVKHWVESTFNTTYDFAPQMMRDLRNKEISVITQEVESGKIFEQDGLVVEAEPVEHGFPTLAYKFTANGKSVVFSGDTQPCAGLTKIAQGADLLIIECSFPEDMGIKPNHLIPSQVGRIAQAAKAKKVLLVHLFPFCHGKEEAILAEIKKHYSGPVEIGQDLQVMEV